MLPRIWIPHLLFTAMGLHSVMGLKHAQHPQGRRGIIPKYGFDPATTKYCTWWLDNSGGWTCERIEGELEVSSIDFVQWNPSLSLPCDVLPINQSFCLAEANPHFSGIPVTVTKTEFAGPNATSFKTLTETKLSTASITLSSIKTITSPVIANITVPITSAVTVTVTTPSIITLTERVSLINTISVTWTPLPITISATKTQTVISTEQITIRTPVTSSLTRFITTPVTAFTTLRVTQTIITTLPVTRSLTATRTATVTSTSTATRTVEKPVAPSLGRNGIVTPLPHQPEMVSNCQTFYYVRKGDTCEMIGARHRISPQQVVSWNPYARADCTMLFADYFACVGVV